VLINRGNKKGRSQTSSSHEKAQKEEGLSQPSIDILPRSIALCQDEKLLPRPGVKCGKTKGDELAQTGRLIANRNELITVLGGDGQGGR